MLTKIEVFLILALYGGFINTYINISSEVNGRQKCKDDSMIVLYLTPDKL